MNIRKRNVIQLLLQAVLMGFMFVEYFLGQYCLRVTDVFREKSSFGSIFEESIVKYQYHNAVVGYLLFGAVALGTIVMLVQFISNDNSLVAAVIPLVEFVVFIVYALVEFNGTVREDHVTEGGGVYYGLCILCAVLGAFSVLSYLKIKKNGFVVSAENKPEKQESTPLSNADELKKYKELLDMGAITQSEYDEKKKQLLDM